jgi:CBS domain-containing protein
MTHVTVSDVMTTDVVSVREDTPFHEIAAALADCEISAVPVVDADRHVLGVVSEADLLLKFEQGSGTNGSRLFERRAHRDARHKADGRVARDLMTEPAITVPTGTVAKVAARLLESNGIKRMPVVDDFGRLVGIVSRHDLLRLFLRPDAEIRREVALEVLQHLLWIAPSEVRVGVDDGVVTLDGEVEQKSLVAIIVRLVRAVDGVVDVVDHLTYQFDDTTARDPEYYRPLV